MNCIDVQQLSSRFIDKDLTSEEHLKVFSHLGHCDACEVYYEDVSITKHALANMNIPSLSSNFEYKLKQKIANIDPTAPVENSESNNSAPGRENLVAIKPARHEIPPKRHIKLASLAASLFAVAFFTGIYFLEPNKVGYVSSNAEKHNNAPADEVTRYLLFVNVDGIDDEFFKYTQAPRLDRVKSCQSSEENETCEIENVLLSI